jgi:hypothetical protein
MSYKIVRMFQDADRPNQNLPGKRNLTLVQAKEHCSDPETSWSSCKFAEGKLRTKTCGPWFDGYEEN